MKKLIFSFLIIGISFITSSAQQKPLKETPDEGVKIFDADKYKDWQKIELPNFSFSAPNDVKRFNEKKRCIDSECYDLKSEKFEIIIDHNFDAGRPTSFERRYESYQDKTFQVGKAFVWFWSFEKEIIRPNHTYNFEIGALFQISENDRLGIYFFSDDKNSKDIAEKIVTSFQFKERKIKD